MGKRLICDNGALPGEALPRRGRRRRWCGWGVRRARWRWGD